MPQLGATASRHPRGALRLRRREVHLVYLSCRERIRERPGDAGRLGSALLGSDLMGALGKALETEFTYMEWLWIEEELANDGFEPGPVDGKLGPTTRAATEAWQRAACQPEAHGALNAFESAVVLVCAGCAVVAVFSPALFLPSFAGAGPSCFGLFGDEPHAGDWKEAQCMSRDLRADHLEPEGRAGVLAQDPAGPGPERLRC